MKPEDEWYTCIRKARPFREVQQLPAELKIPRWFPAVIAVTVVIGAVVGWWRSATPLPRRVAEAAFEGSVLAYILIAGLDAREHFRLEKHVTGHFLGYTVVPFGEGILHVAILAVLVTMGLSARPFQRPFGAWDWFLLASPFLFLALGWLDELLYHRRRALHREDMLHTVSHLLAGAMITSLFAARILDWSVASK